MAECGPLGCWIPRRPRTKRPAGHSSCWLTSPVLADCIVHDDELEALVALCLIGASPSPPESDGPQPLPQSTQSPVTAPEWTAEHPLTEFPLVDIHPAALPVDENLLQQQLSATVQAGMPVGLLGQMLVGSLAAGAVQPQPLLHKPPESQDEMSGIVRPSVKGCYWHVYIARKIAEDQRREKQLESGGGPRAECKANHLLEQGAGQTAQCVPPTAMGGTRVCSTGHCIEQPSPCAALRAAGSSAGGSPRKKQRLQHVQGFAQQLLSVPGSNQLMGAGHISAAAPPAVPAAAAAAGAAAQASSVPDELSQRDKAMQAVSRS
eukprot:gene12763-12892_t